MDEKEKFRLRGLNLLADGYKDDVAKTIADDENFCELLITLISQYVDGNIPVVSGEDKHMLAALLVKKVTIKML